MFSHDLLNGKNIIVTGGGSGLGKSMTKRFVELGAQVYILSRKESTLKETCAEINTLAKRTAVKYFVCDITDAKKVSQIVNEIWSENKIDILVNNAAGNFLCKSENLSSRAFDLVSKIVLNGTTYITLECGKKWIQNNHKGNILSIVATYSWTGSAYVLPSAMAKAGVLAMTRSLACEWGSKNIRLNAIAPGPFPTEGAWQRLIPNEKLGKYFETRNPLGRPGKHIELANLSAFLVSNMSSFINGEVVTIDGGEWLKGAGEFNFLESLTDNEWDQIRNTNCDL